MSALYLRVGGCVEGPFDPAAVRLRLSAGELSWHTMSWKAGEKSWESLAKRWRTGSLWGEVLGIGGTLLVLALLIVVMGIPGRFYRYLPESLQTEAFLFGGVGVGLACATALTTALVFRSWKHYRRLPLLHALCLLLTLMGGAMSIALCMQTTAIVKAEDRLPNAAINYDQTTRAISVRGMIGHHFSRAMAAELRAHGDATVIVIDSPGGLLDQAFNAADMIKESRLPLRVDGMCASACGLIWAAVPNRQMTASSRIGLHQNRMLGDLPVELTAAGSQEMEDKSTAVLTAAGFTDEMLRHRAATPPGKMFWVNAVDIMTAAINAKVVDAHGQPMNLAAAKWMVIASAWGNGSPTDQLYLAIGAHEPALVDTYENRLYDALHGDNLALFRSFDRMMETQAIRQAFSQVPDLAVMEWARSRQHDLAQADQAGNKAACAILTGRASGEPVDAATRTWVNEHSVARTIALINAMPDAPVSLVAQVDVRGAADDFAVYARGIVAHLTQQGFPANAVSWNSLQHCEYSNEFLLGAEKMPLVSGANIVRYGEIGNRLGGKAQ